VYILLGLAAAILALPVLVVIGFALGPVSLVMLFIVLLAVPVFVVFGLGTRRRNR
jgi:hypothetical protein